MLTRYCIMALGKLLFVGCISLLATNSAYSAATSKYSVTNEKNNSIYTEPQDWIINGACTIKSSIYGYRYHTTCESTKCRHVDTLRLAGSQPESVIHTNNTCSGDDVKQRIVRATLRAYAQLRQHKKAIALEEDGMLSHHCSFFRLRTNVYTGDWGVACYHAVIHTQEYTAAHKGYCTTTIPALTGIYGLFFIAPAYCYERFYYRQRGAYPQRYIFEFLSAVICIFIFCTHSGRPYTHTSPYYSTPQHYCNKLQYSGNNLVPAITLQPFHLPVTIAHNTPKTIITTQEEL